MSPNRAVVSREAKENMRLRIRESEEIRGSVMKALRGMYGRELSWVEVSRKVEKGEEMKRC